MTQVTQINANFIRVYPPYLCHPRSINQQRVIEPPATLFYFCFGYFMSRIWSSSAISFREVISFYQNAKSVVT